VVRKLRVLELELSAYRTYADQTHDLDATVRGVPSVSGSSWIQVQQHLRPDILLRLGKQQGNPVYATLVGLPSPVVIPATIKSVQEQIAALEGPPSKSSISEATQLLDSALRQHTTGVDLSKGQRALTVLRTALLG